MEAPTPARDLGLEAQRAAEAHLAACQDAMFAYDEGDEEAESPASAPFCGCDTCMIREILHAAWEILETAAASGETIRLVPCPDAPPADL